MASMTDDSSIREALDAGAINEIEGATLREYRRLVSEVINVDEFSVTSVAAPSRVSIKES
jgi:hypothetical protein